MDRSPACINISPYGTSSGFKTLLCVSEMQTTRIGVFVWSWARDRDCNMYDRKRSAVKVRYRKGLSKNCSNWEGGRRFRIASMLFGKEREWDFGDELPRYFLTSCTGRIIKIYHSNFRLLFWPDFYAQWIFELCCICSYFILGKGEIPAAIGNSVTLLSVNINLQILNL